jgi:hypothetical protein
MPAARSAERRVGIARSAIALLLLAAASSLHAQSAPCGITSITERSRLVYPAIAQAAHVQGPVILLATFEKDGTVSRVKIVSAPLLFDQLIGRVAADYVKGWQANSFSGPRGCPIVVSFNMIEGDKGNKPACSDQRVVLSELTRSDLQHVKISTHSVPLCPAVAITKTGDHQP